MISSKLLIVIATRNRPRLLLSTLTLLHPQLGPNDKVLVSDATDQQPGIETVEFVSNHQTNFTLLPNSTVGLTANRNFALRNVRIEDYDYWCFFDDDLIVEADYLQCVRSCANTLDGNTAFTGFVNSDVPNSPNWLGFYRKSTIKDNILEMPHSVGTWIPIRDVDKFFYESEHFFGYDELELKDYLANNGISLRFFNELRIEHPLHDLATLLRVKKWTIDKTRIIQNARSMRRNKAPIIQILCFILIATTHSMFYQTKNIFSRRRF